MSSKGGPVSGLVQSAYDRWAETYDTDSNKTRDLDAVVLQRQPLRLEGAQVLELGCGTGKNTAWLATAARHVLALDLSEQMLARARQRLQLGNVTFLQHDLLQPWPVPDGSQHIVVGNLVLEHVQDLAPIFREARRVLREEGELFLCELHPYRQMGGAQAHFHCAESGAEERVPSFLHSVSEYVNTALSMGLVLRGLGEWKEDDAAPGAPPRLLSLSWARPGGATRQPL